MTDTTTKDAQADALRALLETMARLRDPISGCPWDLEQDFASIAPYTIEEAYEVADAIARGDMTDLREELGDLLLQVVFHARMAEERNLFAFADVARAITEKLIRRHPHVFADGPAGDADAVTRTWDTIKAEERAAKAPAPDASEPASAPSRLDGVPLAMPQLMRAMKLSKRAARAGFEWPDLESVWKKVDEEIGELKAEIATGAPRDRLEDELGDVLFTLVNIARWLDVDPERALERTNAKVVRRFQTIEREADRLGEQLEDWSLDRMEAIWQTAKSQAR